MRWLDAPLKRLTYRLKSPLKNKHLEAFLRYSSARKLRNLIAVEMAKRTGRTVDFGYPYTLTVEPTNHCNLRCTLCPTGQGLVGREKGYLSLAEFERIVDEVGDYVHVINFQNWGEPMLSRDTPAMIAYTHRKGIYTSIATNGNYPPSRNAALVEAGLDHILFALDGSHQDLYAQYRVGGRFEVVARNIQELIAAREERGAKHPFVEIQFLVFPHNEHDEEEVRELARLWKADGIMVRAAVAPENTTNRRSHYTWNDSKGFCSRFWYTASINSDGGVTPCCHFFHEENDLGNVSGSSFGDVWNNAAFRRSRELVARNEVSAMHPLCQACKVYGAELGYSQYGVQELQPRGDARSNGGAGTVAAHDRPSVAGEHIESAPRSGRKLR
jgi:radical SAM protein with 4Fe4S-binding SPASM domain